jgi:hypothetical protein
MLVKQIKSNDLPKCISGLLVLTRGYAKHPCTQLACIPGSAMALHNGSVCTDPLQPLSTDFESGMGNRIPPCNLSESIG